MSDFDNVIAAIRLLEIQVAQLQADVLLYDAQTATSRHIADDWDIVETFRYSHQDEPPQY